MTWFKVDDGFCEHAKLDALEREHGPRMVADCVLVWLAIGTWCSRQLAQGGALPDGTIDVVAIRRLRRGETDPVACADALVAVGLLERVPEGYAMHDWSEYQPTSEEVGAKRRATRERVREYRERKLRDDQRKGGNGGGNGGGNAGGNGVTEGGVTPSRPGLSRRYKGQNSAAPSNASRNSIGNSVGNSVTGRGDDRRNAASDGNDSGTSEGLSQRYENTSQRYKGGSNAVSNGVSNTPPDPDPDPGVFLTEHTPGSGNVDHHEQPDRGTPRASAGAPPLSVVPKRTPTTVWVLDTTTGFEGRIKWAEWESDQGLPEAERRYRRVKGDAA